MSSRFARIVLTLGLVLSTACAGPKYPDYVPVPDTGQALAWPGPVVGDHGRRVTMDSQSDSTSIATVMVLEDGLYQLWLQRPRVVLTSIRSRSLPPGQWPDSVLIDFRTQSPQFTRTIAMHLDNGTLAVEARAIASELRPRTFTNDHTLTFALPLAEYLHFTNATTGTLEVGGVSLKLTPEHLDAMRAFALSVREAGTPGQQDTRLGR